MDFSHVHFSPFIKFVTRLFHSTIIPSGSVYNNIFTPNSQYYGIRGEPHTDGRFEVIGILWD